VQVDAIVACPGLGARALGGVEDKDVFPVRGQVVLLRAPWIKFGRTASHQAQGLWTYIVPRRSGDVSYKKARLASTLTSCTGHCRWN
jgi:D-amino-acid oxidase